MTKRTKQRKITVNTGAVIQRSMAVEAIKRLKPLNSPYRLVWSYQAGFEDCREQALAYLRSVAKRTAKRKGGLGRIGRK